MKTKCFVCVDNGRSNDATLLAPQRCTEFIRSTVFHWVPLCAPCAEGWFDPSDPVENFPGPIVELKLVLHAG